MDKTKNFALRITNEMFEWLAERAIKNNRSINSEIITIIEESMNMVDVPVMGTIKDGKLYWQATE